MCVYACMCVCVIWKCTKPWLKWSVEVLGLSPGWAMLSIHLLEHRRILIIAMRWRNPSNWIFYKLSNLLKPQNNLSRKKEKQKKQLQCTSCYPSLLPAVKCNCLGFDCIKNSSNSILNIPRRLVSFWHWVTFIMMYKLKDDMVRRKRIFIKRW